MRRYLLDTNCLISFLTDRNIDQQNKISQYFEDAGNLKNELLVACNIISELVYVLEKVYGIAVKKISHIIKALINTPGIIVYNNFYPVTLLDVWPDLIPDYGDAVLTSVALEENLPVITFDRTFSKQLKVLKIKAEFLL